MSAPNESKNGVAVTVALLAGVIVWFVASSGNNSKSSPTTSNLSGDDGKAMAWTMAQEFVTDNLKSPSTASFGGMFSGDFQDYNKTVGSLGGGRFSVNAWVDSQNSFGAVLRTHFVCEVENLGEGKWKCARLEFSH